MIVPVSVILPTRNRAAMMTRLLASLGAQTAMPAEIVICDASDNELASQAVQIAMRDFNDTHVQWRYERAQVLGLAPQRNQAVAASTQPFVWFLDDDVILEPDCLELMHGVLSADGTIGGATASITNQSYSPPGAWVRALMRWFEHGRVRESYAAACVGPGWTFLPDASSAVAAVTPAEWLIGCCSLYRKDALPVPAVPLQFEDGALGEDLAASLCVARTHSLVHVRDAHCLHDSQGGEHKRSRCKLADQGLRNRYHIMTQIMGKGTLRDHFDFALMHAFTLLSLLSRRPDWSAVVPTVLGWMLALTKMIGGAR